MKLKVQNLQDENDNSKAELVDLLKKSRLYHVFAKKLLIADDAAAVYGH